MTVRVAVATGVDLGEHRMTRLARLLAPLALVTPLVLAGCGGSGQEDNAANSGASREKPAPGEKNVAEDAKSNAVRGKDVTPVQGVDSEKLVDVVKGEVKGGE